MASSLEDTRSEGESESEEDSNEEEKKKKHKKFTKKKSRKTCHKKKSFGGALLPGEGEAMAQYVKESKQIPRCGEIKHTNDEIATFESSGYVKGGSRHRHMKAVRLRKEKQIYSECACEHWLCFMMRNNPRQNKILSNLREMIHQKINKKK